MKYGESIFDLFYLLLVIIIGLNILLKSKTKLSILLASAILVLGIGDSFHLIPRVLNYFINYDFNLLLGVGKLITSLTMTIFYILIYYIYLNNYDINENKKVTISIWILSLIRIIICLLPQNGWLKNESIYLMGIIRNIPFALLGLIIILLYFNKRNVDKSFHNIWLYILLSFIFYFIVVIGANYLPILGMFMIPKTICYILIVLALAKKEKLN